MLMPSFFWFIRKVYTHPRLWAPMGGNTLTLSSESTWALCYLLSASSGCQLPNPVPGSCMPTPWLWMAAGERERRHFLLQASLLGKLPPLRAAMSQFPLTSTAQTPVCVSFLPLLQISYSEPYVEKFSRLPFFLVYHLQKIY